MNPEVPAVSAPAATASSGAGKLHIAWPSIACGVFGLGLSLWAWHLHRLIVAGQDTGCGLTETISCDKVIGSKPWGEPFGIPLGVFGAVYFVMVLVTAVSSAGNTRSFALQRLGVGAIGIVFSLGLEYVMWGILHHGCPVCMTTHAVTLLNFLFALVSYLKLRPAAAG